MEVVNVFTYVCGPVVSGLSFVEPILRKVDQSNSGGDVVTHPCEISAVAIAVEGNCVPEGDVLNVGSKRVTAGELLMWAQSGKNGAKMVGS